jgi:hypothetical protein
LWLASLSEKLEAGEILHRLTIVENHAADEHKASLTLAIPEADCCEVEAEVALPNFRQGDAVVLYQRNNDADKVTNQMVFKGNIEYVIPQLIYVA